MDDKKSERVEKKLTGVMEKAYIDNSLRVFFPKAGDRA